MIMAMTSWMSTDQVARYMQSWTQYCGPADEGTKIYTKELCGQVHCAKHGRGEGWSEGWVLRVLDEENRAYDGCEAPIHGQQGNVAECSQHSLEGFVLSLEFHVSFDLTHLNLAVDD